MNKHFSDARYYLGRASKHLAVGLREELEPVASRLRRRLGREPAEPEPTRLQRLRAMVAQSVTTAGSRLRRSQAEPNDDRTA